MSSLSPIAMTFAALLAGCATQATDLGDVAVGGTTYHIACEGAAPAAGVMTQMVVKPTSGPTPTSITGWVGGAESSNDTTQVTGMFDANDGDYDFDVTCPSPMPDAPRFWFAVTEDGETMTGSIAL